MGRLGRLGNRSREHLTPTEIEALIDAAKTNRYGLRDATMILVAYRHGFRASEVCYLEWSAIDFEAATMQVRRVKNGKPSTHPIRGDELRELRKLRKEQRLQSAFLFVTERGALSPPKASTGWSSASAKRPNFHSPYTPTCYATALAISLPAMVTTPVRSKTILDIGTSGIPCATPN